MDGDKGVLADMKQLGIWDPLSVKVQIYKTAIEVSVCLHCAEHTGCWLTFAFTVFARRPFSYCVLMTSYLGARKKRLKEEEREEGGHKPWTKSSHGNTWLISIKVTFSIA